MAENLGDKLEKRRLARKGSKRGDITPFKNIPMEVSAVIGSTQMTVKQLLNLEKGHELDFNATKQVDILVQGRLVARGKLVKLKKGMGIEVLELLPHK